MDGRGRSHRSYKFLDPAMGRREGRANEGATLGSGPPSPASANMTQTMFEPIWRAQSIFVNGAPRSLLALSQRPMPPAPPLSLDKPPVSHLEIETL
jgi:hypothetical protein